MLRLGLLLLILPPLVLMAAWMVDHTAVSGCVDGGGAWDYAQSRCLAGEHHPVPYLERHTLFVNGSLLLALLGVLFCLAGLYRGRE